MQKFIKLLTKKEKYNFFLIFILLLIGSFSEVLSYGLVVPFLNLIIFEKEVILNFQFVQNFPFLNDFITSNSKKQIIYHFVTFFVFFL